MATYSYLHSLATEAAQEFYGRDDFEAFGESELLKERALKASETPQLRVPLGLMGTFRVEGDGLMSAFVSNGHSQDQLQAFSAADVHDCAAAGQYLAVSADWPVRFEFEEVEDFLASDFPSDEDSAPVRLLAGVQVSYDASKDDLVPTLIYNRDLGGIAFRERAAICSGLLALGKGFNDVSSATHYDGGLARAVMQPTERSLDFFAETAAQAIAGGMQIDVPTLAEVDKT